MSSIPLSSCLCCCSSHLPGFCSYARVPGLSSSPPRSCAVGALTARLVTAPSAGGRRLVRVRGCVQQTRRRVVSEDMTSTMEDFSLHLLRNCKIIHLVRHGQGYHNVAGEIDYSAYGSYEYFDACLTPMGWAQVDFLFKNVANTCATEKIELVVTSPLMRTMLTAVGAFGGKQYLEGDPLPPLMIANAGNSHRAAISSSGCPPFIAVEWCREQMGVHPCDKRQSISTYHKLFPAIDFSQIETDDDTLWTADKREMDEELFARGRKFIAWLLKRRERRIVVVSHSSFLNHMLQICGHDCALPIQKELWRGFANCEMRSVVLANRSTLGALISGDYLGDIPLAPSIPNDVADEVMVENGCNKHKI